MGTADGTAMPVVEGFSDLVEVGRGGFSIVYSATQTVLDRRVAIKVFNLTGTEARRLERESRALGALSDLPHVVQAFAVTTSADGRPALVMALMPDSLAARIRRDGVIPAPQVLEWAEQLGIALDAAHDMGIQHRDIKPENVLLSARGDAFLADFGIAALDSWLPGTDTDMSLSPPHAPPERLRGDPDRGPAGDVYSLASTLYTALTGHPPFGTTAEGGAAGLMLRVLEDEVPSDPALPDPLHRALAEAMAKEPRQRPARASWLASALREACTVAAEPFDRTVRRSDLGEPAVGSAAAFDPTRTPEPVGWDRRGDRPTLDERGLEPPAMGADPTVLRSWVEQIPPPPASGHAASGDRAVNGGELTPGQTEGPPPGVQSVRVPGSTWTGKRTAALAVSVLFSVIAVAAIVVLSSGALRSDGEAEESPVARSTRDAAADTSEPSTPATTTSEPSVSIQGVTLSGETPCPPAEGTSQRVQVFAGPPPTCIQSAEHSYSATFTTSEGEFTATLDAGAAPVAVNNFVVLARYHYYDGVPFHRIIPGFVIQAGDGDGEPWGNNELGYSIPDELPAVGDAYTDYSLAMASSGPDTGGSQFFVVLPGGGADLGLQYSRFGEVTEGREVVDTIGRHGGVDEIPTKTVLIEKVTITEVPSSTDTPAGSGSNAASATSSTSSGSTQVDEFCDAVDEYADAMEKANADPRSADTVELTAKATELTRLASGLTAILIDEPELAQQVSECSAKITQAALSG